MPKRFFPQDSSGENQTEEDILYVKLVEDFFRQSQLRLILAGHQPQGDMPLPIRINYDDNDGKGRKGATTGVNNLGWVLCCDTSYSGDTKWVTTKKTQDGSDEKLNPGRGTGPGFRGDLAVR